MHENNLGSLVLDAAFEVHKTLGPGLLESAYEHCMAFELAQKGLNIKTQWPLPLVYKNVKLDCGYRLDLLIEDKIVVEVKAVEAITDIHLAQMLTYLKLTGCKLGYLLNFNVVLSKQASGGLSIIYKNQPSRREHEKNNRSDRRVRSG